MQVLDDYFEAIFYNKIRKTHTYKAEKTKNRCFIKSILSLVDVTKNANKIIVDKKTINEIIAMLE